MSKLIDRMQYRWHVRKVRRAVITVGALMHLLPRPERRRLARTLMGGKLDVEQLIGKVKV